MKVRPVIVSDLSWTESCSDVCFSYEYNWFGLSNIQPQQLVQAVFNIKQKEKRKKPTVFLYIYFLKNKLRDSWELIK